MEIFHDFGLFFAIRIRFLKWIRIRDTGVDDEDDVAGGSDEICKVFDLAKKVEHGQLMHHTVREAAKKSSFLSGPAPLGLVTIGTFNLH